jgi:hypothetical protein
MKGLPHRSPSRLDKTAFPELMKRIGVWIEDTDFNRRAAKYGQEAHLLHNARVTNARVKAERLATAANQSHPIDPTEG